MTESILLSQHIHKQLETMLLAYKELMPFFDLDDQGMYNLIQFRAIDTKKDMGVTGPAVDSNILHAFGYAPTSKDVSDLKYVIVRIAEDLEKIGALTLQPYTRHVSNKPLDITSSHKIYDAGPKFDGKQSPLLAKVDGTRTMLTTTLGNRIDSGPSHEAKINYHFEPHILDTSDMTALGFSGAEFIVENPNHTYKLYLPYYGLILDAVSIQQYAIGNHRKDLEMVNAALDPKRKYTLLMVKALGDTLLVYYWFKYCLEQKETCTLITEDTLGFFMAYLLSKDRRNAQITFCRKGDKTEKITHCYIKSVPPNYKKLYEKEKTAILKIVDNYVQRLTDILNQDAKYKVKGSNDTYQSAEFINAILEQVIRLGWVVRTHVPNEEWSVHYQEMKSYYPISLFQKNGSIMIASKTSICIHKSFLNQLKLKQLHFGFQREGRGLRSKSKSTSYSLDMDKASWNHIYHLAYNIYFEVLKPHELLFFQDIGMAPRTQWSANAYDVEPYLQEDTLYDVLTYYFYVEPIYTDEKIRQHIDIILTGHSLVSIKKSRTQRSRRPKTARRSTRRASLSSTYTPVHVPTIPLFSH